MMIISEAERDRRYTSKLCVGCANPMDRNMYYVQLCSECIKHPPTAEELSIPNEAKGLYYMYLRFEGVSTSRG